MTPIEVGFARKADVELQEFALHLKIEQVIGDVKLKYGALKLAEKKMSTANELFLVQALVAAPVTKGCNYYI